MAVDANLVIFDPATGTTRPLRATDLGDPGGTFAYATGAAAGSIDVPGAARLRRVQVRAGGSAASIKIGNGPTIALAAGLTFDEDIPGEAVGADVVLGGTVAFYYVAWVTP